MKTYFYASVISIILAFPVAIAQEARIEQFTTALYGTKYQGSIFYNEIFHVNESTSPVVIVDAKVRHIPHETADTAKFLSQYASDLDSIFVSLGEESVNIGNLAREGLTITVNARGENVVAVKFGVIVYDAFKEYLGGLTAITMDPPTTNMQWTYNPPYLFKFRKYGVVSIFVRQARLKNGKIWNFDENFVTKKFSERFGKLTKKQIKESGS